MPSKAKLFSFTPVGYSMKVSHGIGGESEKNINAMITEKRLIGLSFAKLTIEHHC